MLGYDRTQGWKGQGRERSGDLVARRASGTWETGSSGQVAGEARNGTEMSDRKRKQGELFEESGETFECLAITNGSRYWSARDLMKVLGYDDWPSFKKVISKALSACALLNIDIFEMFIPNDHVEAGKTVEDFKLTRFACFMTALNGDTKKPNVAAAQAYFVSIAETVMDLAIEHAESMDRLFIRDEISEHEVLLSATATSLGVKNLAFFSAAGYRGMYDMGFQDLRELRGLKDSKRSLLDFMGKDELAGNLFRLTLTEGRLRKDQPSGQIAAEHIAEQVGRRVRNTMIEETGVAPEQLPTAQDIKEVRKGLKKAGKGFRPLDDVEGQRVIEAQVMQEMIPERSDDAVPGCPECGAGSAVPHNGSPDCTSGSIASGGTKAHCACEYCY
jgi:DNA-damage-inducible protein D